MENTNKELSKESNDYKTKSITDIENKYRFSNVKKQLETLPTLEAKIELIEHLKTEYLQEDLFWDFDHVPFNKKCDLELAKLHNLLDLRLKIEKNNDLLES